MVKMLNYINREKIKYVCNMLAIDLKNIKSMMNKCIFQHFNYNFFLVYFMQNVISKALKHLPSLIHSFSFLWFFFILLFYVFFLLIGKVKQKQNLLVEEERLRSWKVKKENTHTKEKKWKKWKRRENWKILKFWKTALKFTVIC